MLFLNILASVAALATTAFSQQIEQSTANNGVHVPGSRPTNLYEPLEQRLAYAGATGMTVSWNTYIGLVNPTVYWGVTPFLGNVTTSNVSITYPTSRTWSNHVLINGLTPNTKYYYRVQYTNCLNCAYIPTYSFTTSRVAGDMTSFSVAIVVDMGVMGPDGLSGTVAPLSTSTNALGPNDTNTMQSLLMLKDTYDFVGHWGDHAYADSYIKEAYQGVFGLDNSTRIPANMSVIVESYESLLEQYYDQLTPITAEKPYMVGVGNHEMNCNNGGTTDKIDNITYTVANCSVGQTNATGYQSHWRMPAAQSGGNTNLWYSFNHGMVHFVVIDSETDLGNGIIGPSEPKGSGKESSGPFGAFPEQQVNWLAADLAAVNRSVTPWISVGMHRPWYLSATGVDPGPQKAFEQLFNTYKVDLVMAGHEHIYQRNQPLGMNATVDPAGLNNPTSPWYIVNGAAGHYDGLDTLAFKANYSVIQTDKIYGWSRLTFHNATHMTHDFVASGNGTVLDSTTLFKIHATTPVTTSDSVSSITNYLLTIPAALLIVGFGFLL